MASHMVSALRKQIQAERGECCVCAGCGVGQGLLEGRLRMNLLLVKNDLGLLIPTFYMLASTSGSHFVFVCVCLCMEMLRC